MSGIFDLPKLKDDSFFEDLVCDIFSRKFINPNLQRFGRKGQAQYGLDILGFNFGTNEIEGIQCKNHLDVPTNKIQSVMEADITESLEKLKKAGIKLNNFYYVTSAASDSKITSMCLALSKNRLAQGQSMVTPVFWSDLMSSLDNYPDLVYKYYSKNLPTDKFFDLKISDLNVLTRKTILKTSKEILNEKEKIKEILLELNQTQNIFKKVTSVKPRTLYLGVTTQKNSTFDQVVDLTVYFEDFYVSKEQLEDRNRKIIESIKALVEIIKSTSMYENIIIYTDIEISLAFQLGLAFRKNRIQFKVIYKKQLWSSVEEDTPAVESRIKSQEPLIIDNSSTEAVLIFDAVGRKDLKDIVLKNINDRNFPTIKYIVHKYIVDGRVSNSAHASIVAKELSNSIMEIQSWGIKDIHLFLAIPKPISLMAGHKLDSLNAKLHVYFLGADREIYQRATIITNSTF